jgi:hypothetical protein
MADLKRGGQQTMIQESGCKIGAVLPPESAAPISLAPAKIPSGNRIADYCDCGGQSALRAPIDSLVIPRRRMAQLPRPRW